MARESKTPVPDHGLWEDVAKGITPLKAKFRFKPKLLNTKLLISGTRAAPLATTNYNPRPLPIMPRIAHASSLAPPPLASFDRRTAQRLSRGQEEPQSVIDLHGEGLENARMKLLHFFMQQQHRGSRLVLVITGKGASPYARHTLHGVTHFNTPEREGRLRREVPEWLHESQFRAHVVGFQPAHPKHGGGGAFYVRLRRLAGEQR
jgi:DNA-nicking Smr family endonuclease